MRVGDDVDTNANVVTSGGDDERSPEERAYLGAVLATSAIAAELLAGMERVAEQLAPERSAALAAEIEGRYGGPLAEATAALAAAPAPEVLAPFDALYGTAFQHAVSCATLFAGFPAAPGAERIARILASLHHHAQAQEHFYVIRELLPAFRDYWSHPDADVADAAAAPATSTADAPARSPLVRVSAGGHHGGFSLYVPEIYDEARAWPVIVALHGGSGNGRDFLWTWLRDARRRGYVLVAPSAVGSTWSAVEEQGLLEILAWIGARYRIDHARVLLTGLSDGATFALVYGLAHPETFRALAPCCGVFHPVNFQNGNLERAAGKAVYLVHGAQDFLFPVAYAQMTRDLLRDAGADLTYRELPELSHTYPRSENPAILDWFEAKTRRA